MAAPTPCNQLYTATSNLQLWFQQCNYATLELQPTIHCNLQLEFQVCTKFQPILWRDYALQLFNCETSELQPIKNCKLQLFNNETMQLCNFDCIEQQEILFSMFLVIIWLQVYYFLHPLGQSPPANNPKISGNHHHQLSACKNTKCVQTTSKNQVSGMFYRDFSLPKQFEHYQHFWNYVNHFKSSLNTLKMKLN